MNNPTLSGEKNLLSIAWQTQPRWCLSIWEHFHPVHELFASAKQNHAINVITQVIIKGTESDQLLKVF